jgi:transposase-like protein
MSKTISKYYPKSSGIVHSKPSSCYCGNGDNFTRIMLHEKNSIRYMCKNCKKSYIVKSSQTTKLQLKKMGNIFDNIVYGMSSRQTCLKMFIDWGEIIKHPTILKWSTQYLQYAKMFTDDILCCLEYGKVWGIDETVINIQGITHDADEKLLSEMKTIEQKRQVGGFLNDTQFKKEWERLRTMSENSKRTSKKKYLTAIIDIKTRIIIHYMITDSRPDNKKIYKLVKTAILVAGFPTDIITDCYKAYKPAMNKISKDIQNHNNSKLNHILIRSKDQSTLHLKLKKSKDNIPRHNNNIESTWAKIKRNMDVLSNYKYNSDNVIHYNIINYNFIRPHSSLDEIVVTRHETRNRVNMTPAMYGGYPQWFATFEELLIESWGYDKSFVFKLGANRMEMIRIGIRNKKTVVISTKEKTPKSKIIEIDRILQVECGFINTKKNEWKKDMPSILNMNRRREENVGGIMPEQTFEVCNKCGVTAITTQTVSEIIGYRKSDGRIITQPNCHKCRTKLSKNPSRKTGPNKKKMIQSSLMVGNSQIKLD